MGFRVTQEVTFLLTSVIGKLSTKLSAKLSIIFLPMILMGGVCR